jgi:hypothetical protein
MKNEKEQKQARIGDRKRNILLSITINNALHVDMKRQRA